MKPKETAKRMIALLLALVTAALCCACSGGGNTPTGGDSDKSQNTQTQRPGGSSTEEQHPGDSSAEEQRPGSSSTETQQPDTDSPEKTVRLEKCESTGEVGFDKIYLPNYDMIYLPNDASDIFPFSHNGIGYINDKGEIVLKEKWDTAGVFSEGKALVEDSDGWHVIDRDGNVLFSTKETFCSGQSLIGNDDRISAKLNIPYFSNGAAISVLSYFNTSGRLTNSKILTIDDKFNFNSFDDQKLIDIKGLSYWPTEVLTGSVRGFIIPIPLSDNGELAIYNKIYSVSGDLLFSGNKSTYLGDKYVLSPDNNIVDITSGDVILKFEYEKCGAPSDGVIPVCAYDKWGLIDTDGNELIKPKYAYLSAFSHDLGFALDFDGNGLLINKSGEVIANLSDEIFDGDDDIYVKSFTDSGFIFIANDDSKDELDKGFLITETGEIIFSGDADEFKYISAGYVVYGDDLYKVVVE